VDAASETKELGDRRPLLHVPFGYFPDASGGTEVYVRGLVRELASRGISGAVAAPGLDAASYMVDGVPVRRYPAEPTEAAARAFASVLDELAPSLVHFHALSPAVNADCARAAKARGLPVVWTYHTPTLSCARGTMMRFGTTPCDGEFRAFRCTACASHALSGSRFVAGMLAAVPASASAVFGRALPGRLGTALGSRARQVARDAGFHAAMAEADCIVAVCDWVRSALLANGLPPEKIVVSRQGLVQAIAAPASRNRDAYGGPLRIAYFGRIDPTKGVHVLIEALAAIPDVSVRLDIHGVVQPGAEHRLGALCRQAAGDDRIRFLAPLAMDAVPGAMAAYDFVAVPSRWLETGPLVVLEAFAAGVPVLGSRLGGIAELVRDGIDGLLLPVADAKAWAVAIQRLAQDPGRVAALRAGVRPPRTMAAVANDMLAIYRRLLGKPRDGTSGNILVVSA
jgi:glycosyltransferase involved in cell wall biosynthesis